MELNVEELSAVVVDTAFHLYRDLGPGLLESVYEVILAKHLQGRGLSVARQLPVTIVFAGLRLDEGFRADLVVDRAFVVELKSVEQFAPVHAKQLLAYLRLMQLPLGLLINFGAPSFREGVRRVANNHRDFAASRLRGVAARTGGCGAAALPGAGARVFLGTDRQNDPSGLRGGTCPLWSVSTQKCWNTFTAETRRRGGNAEKTKWRSRSGGSAYSGICVSLRLPLRLRVSAVNGHLHDFETLRSFPGARSALPDGRRRVAAQRFVARVPGASLRCRRHRFPTTGSARSGEPVPHRPGAPRHRFGAASQPAGRCRPRAA